MNMRLSLTYYSGLCSQTNQSWASVPSASILLPDHQTHHQRRRSLQSTTPHLPTTTTAVEQVDSRWVTTTENFKHKPGVQLQLKSGRIKQLTFPELTCRLGSLSSLPRVLWVLVGLALRYLGPTNKDVNWRDPDWVSGLMLHFRV